MMALRRRGEHKFQGPPQRTQNDARDHLVVAPRVPGQRPEPSPQFEKIEGAKPRKGVGPVRADPGGGEALCKLRRHHPIGGGYAGIAAVQVRHDEVEIGQIVPNRQFHAPVSLSLDATLSMEASSRTRDTTSSWR